MLSVIKLKSLGEIAKWPELEKLTTFSLSH